MKSKISKLLPLFVLLCLFGDNVIYASGGSRNPILILGTDKNFGSYIAEILKTEGFNEFERGQITDAKITLNYLKRFDIVILAEMMAKGGQAAMIKEYVSQGGNLIACIPDSALNDVFGIVTAGGTFNEAYIRIDTAQEIGKGLTTETLQVHGEALRYDLKNGKKLATIYKDALSATGYPAIVENDYGKGHSTAFLYNLPKSIVYTRQGNFTNAGKEMDGIDGIRAMDMFTNGWLDTTKNTLNQADEQMRLLSHSIEKMSSYRKPLPRFWYFPDTLKCLVTLTNDGEDSKESEFYEQFEDVDAKMAKMTLYIKETDLVSRAWVDKWVKKDFEMAGHFDDTRQAQNPDWNTMDTVIRNLKKQLAVKFGISDIQTVTNHWFVWCGKDSNGVSDFAAQAKLEAANDIGLDNNYARYDNNSNQGYFLGAMGTGQGNFTGSGLSMKFSDNEGKVINTYQHLCNVYDQQYMEHNDSTGFFNCFKGLMDRSLDQGVYSYISIKAHNAEYFFSKPVLAKMLDYANENKIPVWTAAKLYKFLVAKDEARFTNFKWTGSRLTFRIRSSSPEGNRLTTMIPYNYKGNNINNIKVNGRTVPYTVASVKGFQYALVPVSTGSDYLLAVSYGQ